MHLSDESFQFYAARHYDNPQCHSIEEFEDDLKRFQYLRRLMKRYRERGELKTRLILNHLTVLYNCFDQQATAMLFMRLEGFHSILKPFLLFFNRLPPTVNYNGVQLNTSDIALDSGVVDQLREYYRES